MSRNTTLSRRLKTIDDAGARRSLIQAELVRAGVIEFLRVGELRTARNNHKQALERVVITAREGLAAGMTIEQVARLLDMKPEKLAVALAKTR